MMNCIIVDDEPLAQQVLEKHIRVTEELRLVKKCDNAIEAFRALHSERVDLVFLDVKMPVISGIDFIRSINHPPAVIFTTAFSEYAVTGYELEAVDYLLKPVTYERFRKSVDRFLRNFERPPVLVPAKESEQGKVYLYIKVTGKLVKVLYTDIRYAESMKDYIRIRTVNGNLVTHMTMKSLMGVLPRDPFFRIHRSFIVNTQYVSSVGRTAVWVGEAEIPAGENYKDNIEYMKERLKQ